jgi:hypothetical protein
MDTQIKIKEIKQKPSETEGNEGNMDSSIDDAEYVYLFPSTAFNNG